MRQVMWCLRPLDGKFLDVFICEPLHLTLDAMLDLIPCVLIEDQLIKLFREQPMLSNQNADLEQPHKIHHSHSVFLDEVEEEDIAVDDLGDGVVACAAQDEIFVIDLGSTDETLIY